MTPSVAMHSDASDERRPAERRRLFWLGWVGAFAAVGIASGVTALVISFLTALTVIHESRGLSIGVSAMLMGCLASLLLAAHGMDRLTLMRMESERRRTIQIFRNEFNSHIER